jgi:hypothetical protein
MNLDRFGQWDHGMAYKLSKDGIVEQIEGGWSLNFGVRADEDDEAGRSKEPDNPELTQFPDKKLNCSLVLFDGLKNTGSICTGCLALAFKPNYPSNSNLTNVGGSSHRMEQVCYLFRRQQVESRK